MAKIRVHALAQKMNLSSKELLAKLEKLGIEAKSHISSIDEKVARKLTIISAEKEIPLALKTKKKTIKSRTPENTVKKVKEAVNKKIKEKVKVKEKKIKLAEKQPLEKQVEKEKDIEKKIFPEKPLIEPPVDESPTLVIEKKSEEIEIKVPDEFRKKTESKWTNSDYPHYNKAEIMDNTDRKDHRKQERVPYSKDLTINYTLTIKVKSIDISIGGLYIYTEQSLRLGTMVEIFLPYKEQRLKVKAEVKHIQEGVGIGLMFVDLDKNLKAKIEELILDLKKKPEQFKADKPKVLFVDDNQMSRKMIKHKLLSEGFWIIEADNGVEAIKALGEGDVDVILLDLFMEKMNGFKVLSIVKGSPKWKDIPVIVYSAKGTEDVIDRAMNAGADDFLLKMITSPAKLAESIRNVIKRYKEQGKARK